MIQCVKRLVLDGYLLQTASAGLHNNHALLIIGKRAGAQYTDLWHATHPSMMPCSHSKWGSTSSRPFLSSSFSDLLFLLLSPHNNHIVIDILWITIEQRLCSHYELLYICIAAPNIIEDEVK